MILTGQSTTLSALASATCSALADIRQHGLTTSSSWANTKTRLKFHSKSLHVLHFALFGDKLKPQESIASMHGFQQCSGLSRKNLSVGATVVSQQLGTLTHFSMDNLGKSKKSLHSIPQGTLADEQCKIKRVKIITNQCQNNPKYFWQEAFLVVGLRDEGNSSLGPELLTSEWLHFMVRPSSRTASTKHNKTLKP